VLPALAATLLAAGVLLAFAGSERSARPAAQALAELEGMLDRAGYGLTQVSLTGHRFTPDSDIFDALELARTPTVLSFDTAAAQARIERLPWIERASIERVLPDRLEVHVTERAPYAVWRLGARHFLIDRTGSVLAPVASEAAPTLPRLAGEGAAGQARALHRALTAYPALARQVEVAERVGGRRWTLWLAGGRSIALPAEGEPQALARASLLVEALPAWASQIDLRAEGRTLVRATPGRDPETRPEPPARLAADGL
jgi:cell division protein FtsQ